MTTESAVPAISARATSDVGSPRLASCTAPVVSPESVASTMAELNAPALAVPRFSIVHGPRETTSPDSARGGVSPGPLVAARSGALSGSTIPNALKMSTRPPPPRSIACASRGVSATGALALDAPFDAVLQAVHAGPGQTVAAAAPLFDLVRLDTVWIRVPLYAGDIDQIDRRAPARVVPLGAAGTSPGTVARPVTAPPSADPSTAAVDLYYAAPNPGGALRPGQRVGVRVPLTSPAQSLVVPRAALLHDAYGGSWVYEARESNVFVRRRVSVVDLVEDLAVLDQGPPPGTRVVTAGAAELFGTEFGAGK